jgi:hypothetical protein
MRKKDKIRLVILEGQSDQHFFSEFKRNFDRRELEIQLLKKEGLNFEKIGRAVEANLNVLGYKEVWLVMDLKTQKVGSQKNYDTAEEMIKDYKHNLKNLDGIDYVVMVQDLECWLLVYFSKYENTETIHDAEGRIKKLMDIKSSISKNIVVRRLTKKPDFWNKLLKNRRKNRSLSHFFDKARLDQ